MGMNVSSMATCVNPRRLWEPHAPGLSRLLIETLCAHWAEPTSNVQAWLTSIAPWSSAGERQRVLAVLAQPLFQVEACIDAQALTRIAEAAVVAAGAAASSAAVTAAGAAASSAAHQ